MGLSTGRDQQKSLNRVRLENDSEMVAGAVGYGGLYNTRGVLSHVLGWRCYIICNKCVLKYEKIFSTLKVLSH